MFYKYSLFNYSVPENRKKKHLNYFAPLSLKLQNQHCHSSEEKEIPRIDIMGNHELYLGSR